MYAPEIAYELLKARLDRGGMPVPIALEDYWRCRIEAAALELEKKGHPP